MGSFANLLALVVPLAAIGLHYANAGLLGGSLAGIKLGENPVFSTDQQKYVVDLGIKALGLSIPIKVSYEP